MPAARPARIRLSLKQHGGRPPRLTSKEMAVAEFKHWDQMGRRTPPTARILVGLFYQRYKEHFRLFPPSEIRDDVANLDSLLRNFLSDDAGLAPWVVEVFFTLKHFENLKTASVCNRNVLHGWSIFEKARKLQRSSHVGRGEQAEFLKPTVHTAFGSIRV